jgi:hypothetical protein
MTDPDDVDPDLVDIFDDRDLADNTVQDVPDSDL